ncbi:hypothetical protein B0E41_15805 [Hydrogenophaga sp. A37]|nr:hypothetical protein B0E41_15805 [Hydrogenophaga sp. A37]
MTWGLSAVAAVFLGASVLGQVGHFVWGWTDVWQVARMTDVGIEQNLPTYFSLLLILGNVVLLSLIARFRHGQRDAWCWKVLVVGFLYLAFDEGFHVHENWVHPMRQMLGGDQFGLFYFAWVVPGLLITLMVGITLTGFLWRLPLAHRIRFLVSAMLFLGGCLGMEMLAGRYLEAHGAVNLAVHLMSDLEEALEMAGMIFFMNALCRYLAEFVPDIRVGWRERAGPPTTIAQSLGSSRSSP